MPPAPAPASPAPPPATLLPAVLPPAPLAAPALPAVPPPPAALPPLPPAGLPAPAEVLDDPAAAITALLDVPLPALLPRTPADPAAVPLGMTPVPALAAGAGAGAGDPAHAQRQDASATRASSRVRATHEPVCVSTLARPVRPVLALPAPAVGDHLPATPMSDRKVALAIGCFIGQRSLLEPQREGARLRCRFRVGLIENAL
jgi:hypothetical protein